MRWTSWGRAPAGGEIEASSRVRNDRRLWVPPSMGSGWNGSVTRLGAILEDSSTYGSSYHAPVMVREVLHYLDPAMGGLYLDGTLGGGGHTEAILDSNPDTRVIATDRDPEARAEAAERLGSYGDRVRIVASNFADAIEAGGIEPGSLAGALLDLGISSHQIDVDHRGFTFRPGAPLDMRMEGESHLATAAELLNESREEELADIFYHWGEEKRSRRLARLIVEKRADQPLRESGDLVELIDRAVPRAGVQDHARIFQALRIAVNEEIAALKRALPAIREALEPGAVMVVISYHSIEDRVVKDAFREWSRECVCPPGLPVCVCRGEALGETLTRKPVGPTPEELETNPRSRSGRLRAWRKK